MPHWPGRPATVQGKAWRAAPTQLETQARHMHHRWATHRNSALALVGSSVSTSPHVAMAPW